jgi:tryptophan halogenase
MRLHHLSGPAAQAADRLLGLASNVPLAGVERSCKLSRGVLSRERLLLGQARAQLAGTAMDIAHSTLGMPTRAKPSYEQDHQRANFVYLGFDGSTDSLSYRIYLEFPVNLAHQYDPATGQMGKALLARGYKWDALHPERDLYDVTDYWWYPKLTVDQIAQKLAALWSQQTDAPAAFSDRSIDATKTLVGQIIDLARQRSNALDWQYLEATEPATLRHSFDLNVYQAELHLTEVAEELAALGDAMGIACEDMAAFMKDAGTSTLGHVSGGLGRDGLPFLTVYYTDAD